MSTYLLSHCLHKFQTFRLTYGIFEGEGIISCFYDRGQGVGEVVEIFWRGLISIFMVDKLGCKNCCLWKNVIGGRHGHICKEVNEAKYLWYAFFPLVFVLDYFYLP